MDHADTNDAKGTSIDEVGISSSPDSQANERPDVSGAGISTVDAEPVKDATGTAADAQKKDGDGKDDAAAASKTDGEGKPGDKGDEGRFDKHPDWQRMMKDRDDAVARAAALEAKIDLFTRGQIVAPGDGQAQPAAAPAAGDTGTPALPFKDITKLSKEELIEWFEDDPIGYEANRFAQFLHETKIMLARDAEVTKKVTTVAETFDNYSKANPDFGEMLASGEIKKFMEQNPGHNSISAHQVMTSEKRIQAAVEKAEKETREQVLSDVRIKRNADTIGDAAGSARPQVGVPGELKDTKQQGGLVTAIAARLQKMRSAA